ncbi:MAG: hypothetical protein AAFW83_07100 [Pseudomonadota bacterium]
MRVSYDLIRSAIGFLLLANILTACGKDKEPRLNNWSELCARTDCERFPVGYTTVVIEGNEYFFPLDGEIFDAGGARGTLYMERDDEDRLIRVARLDARRLRFLQYNSYLERFSMPTLPFYLAEVGLSKSRPGRNWGWINMDMVRALVPDHLAELEQFSDDFYLLESSDAFVYKYRGRPQNDVNNGIYHPVKLISKTPLYNGQYVIVSCGAYCDITLLTAESKTDALAFSLSVNALNHANCHKTEAGCLTHKQWIGEIPSAVRSIELFVQNLTLQPER